MSNHLHGPGCTHPPTSIPTPTPTPTPAQPPGQPGRVRALRTSAFGLLAVVAGLTAVVYVRNPLTHTVFPPCPFHVATGGWCPGCGATRASYLLLHGRVIDALHYNALWVVLAPFALWQLVGHASQSAGWRIHRIPMTRPVVVILLVAMTGFFVVRNLPIHALHVLNPPSSS